MNSSVDTSHIPIILLTALSERENIIFGLEAGANDYIIKPFDLSVLKVRIRNILQNRQHLRETVLAMDAQPERQQAAANSNAPGVRWVMTRPKVQVAAAAMASRAMYQTTADGANWA